MIGQKHFNANTNKVNVTECCRQVIAEMRNNKETCTFIGIRERLETQYGIRVVHDGQIRNAYTHVVRNPRIYRKPQESHTVTLQTLIARYGTKKLIGMILDRAA